MSSKISKRHLTGFAVLGMATLAACMSLSSRQTPRGSAARAATQLAEQHARFVEAVSHQMGWASPAGIEKSTSSTFPSNVAAAEFASSDRNGDLLISLDEFIATAPPRLRNDAVKALFQQMDTNLDGMLDLSEWNWLYSVDGSLALNALSASAFDQDGDGGLGLGEFASMLQQSFGGSAPPPPEIIGLMFSNADRDKNGLVTFVEAAQFAKRAMEQGLLSGDFPAYLLDTDEDGFVGADEMSFFMHDIAGQERFTLDSSQWMDGMLALLDKDGDSRLNYSELKGLLSFQLL